jgi:molecular chaperone DnaK
MHLAIDWGTSYTKLGYLHQGRLINLAGTGSSIPTAAALSADCALIVGPAALRLRDNIRTIPQFKLELKRNREFHLGPFNMESLLNAYFSNLRDTYVAVLGQPVESITIGVPNYFGLNARRLLLDTIKNCFATDMVQLMPEPAAALIGYNLESRYPLTGEVLSIDIGGGTCDFSFLSAGTDSYTIESQLQTGNDSFSGNEIDRAIVHNILWPEFVMQTGFSPAAFPISGSMSPLEAYTYNRMLQAAQNTKIELGQQQETYINLPDFYNSKSLQMMLDRAAFLSRTSSIFESLRTFIDTSIRARAHSLGLMNKEGWALDGILLVGGASFITGVNELLTKAFPHVPLVLPQERSFNVLRGLAAQAAYSNAFTLKTLYPFTFYIERYDSARQASILEKIPFDLHNLKLQFNQNYVILTLDQNTPFNLSPDPQYCHIRIYEGDAETPDLPDRFSGRDLVFELYAPKVNLPQQMAVCLNLSRAELALKDGRENHPLNSETTGFEKFYLNQTAWFNQISRAQPNPALISDYQQHLAQLKQSGLSSFAGYDRSTLLKLYALIDIWARNKRKE